MCCSCSRNWRLSSDPPNGLLKDQPVWGQSKLFAHSVWLTLGCILVCYREMWQRRNSLPFWAKTPPPACRRVPSTTKTTITMTTQTRIPITAQSSTRWEYLFESPSTLDSWTCLCFFLGDHPVFWWRFAPDEHQWCRIYLHVRLNCTRLFLWDASNLYVLVTIGALATTIFPIGLRRER